jgi:segregation and condensation protein B
MTMTPVELKSALEAIIYAADEPATVEQMAKAVGEEKHLVRTALDELVGGYGSDERGIEVRAVAGGYRVYTKPQHHDVVRRFIKSLRPPLRLTMPALETLAVVAYKQPVTQPEIQEIRGVSCAGVLQTLLERRLITTAGRKQVIGRPILYRTSKEFMMRFGLSDLEDLPSLKEFEALAREALGTEDGVGESAITDSTEAGEFVESGESTDSTELDAADVVDVPQAPAAPEEPTPVASPSAEAVSAAPVERGEHIQDAESIQQTEHTETEANTDVAEPSEKAAGRGAS